MSQFDAGKRKLEELKKLNKIDRTPTNTNDKEVNPGNPGNTHTEKVDITSIVNAALLADNISGTRVSDDVMPAPVETKEDSDIFEGNIADYINSTLAANGIEADSDLVSYIYVEIIKASMNGELMKPNIGMITDLVDILLKGSGNNLGYIELLTELQNSMLTGSYKDSSVTYDELKEFIMKAAEEYISSIPEPEPEPDPDPVDPLEQLFNDNKFNNNSFAAAYIDTIKDEFCLTDKANSETFYGIIKGQILAKVAELGLENIDFEAAKQIIYDTMHGIWPLKTEVAEVIKQTPNGKDLSDEEVMGIVNSISRDIYVACYTIYFHQTGDKKALTPEEKLGAINNVLQTKRPDLYEVVQPEPDPDPVEVDPLEAIYNQYGFNSPFWLSCIESYMPEFCFPEESNTTTGIQNFLISQFQQAYLDTPKPVSFESAKQIIYEQMHNIFPLKSEVIDIITSTPNGQNLSEDEINAIIDTVRMPIYLACKAKRKEIYQQTGKMMIVITPEQKAEIINDVLRANCPQLYEEPQVNYDAQLEAIFQQSGILSDCGRFTKAYILSVCNEFCFPAFSANLDDPSSIPLDVKLKGVYDLISSQVAMALQERGLTTGTVDFETAKEIIYDELQKIYAKVSEFVDVVKKTPYGANMSEEEIIALLNSTVTYQNAQGQSYDVPLKDRIWKACKDKRNEMASSGNSWPVLTDAQIEECILSTLHNFKPELFENNSSATDEPLPPSGELIIASTPEEAMQILLNKMDSAYVGNLSVESFLLQLEAEAAQYIKLQFNFEQSFANVIAKYIANAIGVNFSPVSGLAKDADLDLIKEKFTTFIQDMSFLNRTQRIDNKTYSGLISYSPDINGPITNDYIQTSLNSSGYKLHGNSKGGYNENGDLNSKTCFDFINNYFVNVVYGGNLNEVQMQFLYQKVMLKFGNSWSYASLTSAGFDKNSNGSVLDDLWTAMMAVAEEYPNLSNSGIENIDLDALFGSNSYLTADALRIKDTKITLPGGKTDYALHLSNNKYISNSDAGVSMLMSELINTAKKWHITIDDADNTYQIDFINAFIKLLSEECGLTVQYDQNGNPKLTRELLEKYLSNHTPDELKALINSDVMRTAYYDEIYNKSDGVVSGEFTQGPNGDCWFCSVVKALTSSPAGQEILANAVTRNADGSYTVRFKGTGTYDSVRYQGDYEYTITKEELYERLRSGNHMFGDIDNIVLEMALSRHIKETIYDKGGWQVDRAMEANIAYGGDPYLGNLGNYPLWRTEDVIHLFTGELYKDWKVNWWSFSNYHTADFKEFILEKLGLEPGTEGAIASGTCGNYVLQVDIVASSNNGIATLHACSITRVSEDYVWFVNPYTNVEEKMTWDEFVEKAATIYCILLPEQS